MSLINEYRPKTWADLAGHSIEVARLKGIIKRDSEKQPPNALFFAGNTGTGKTTLARMFANYMNCEKHSLCGKCKPCKSKGADILEINAATHTKIDDMRALLDMLKFKPQYGKYRFIILDEIQQVSPQSEQCLLKTLEEPPKHVIFLLCSMTPEKVDEAILTRCSYFDLKPPSKEDVSSRLKEICASEGAAVPESVISTIAENSIGSVRLAVQLLDSVIQLLAEVEGKPEKEIEKYLLRAVSGGGLPSDDDLAIQVVSALFTRDSKTVHRALLDVTDFNTFVNKLSYLTMYVSDRALVGNHKQVWHTSNNKRLYSELEKAGIDPKKCIKQSYAILDELNAIKYRMGSFMSNNRHILTAQLSKLC